MVFTSRPGAKRSDGLSRYLDRPEKVESIDLGPLDGESVRRLLTEASGGQLPKGVRERIVDLCGGNPYFALELLRAHRDRGELEPTGKAGPLGTELVDERLERVLRERLRGVSVDGLKVLEALAVLGGRASWDLVLSMARVDVDDPSWICEQLTRNGLLETGDGEVEFTHHILRELIYADLGEIRRYSLHRLAAEALAQSGEASRGVLADHFHLGGDPVRAFHYATAAARDAESRGAHLEAARYADRALAAAADESPPEEVELRRLAARAYSSAGELEEAARRLEPLLGTSDADRTEEEVRALLELAEVQIEPAAEDAARETLARARRAVEASEPGTTIARLEPAVISTELRLEIHFGDRPSIDEAGDRLKTVAGRTESENGGLDGRVGLALAAYLAFFESAEKARHLLQEVRGEDLPPRLELRALLLLGAVEVRSCQWDRAEYLLKRGLRKARERKDVPCIGLYLNNLGCLRLERGRWSEAREYLKAVLELEASLRDLLEYRIPPLLNDANTRFYQLKSSDASSRYRNVLGEAKEAEAHKYEAEARACLGLLNLQRGQRRAAERQYRKMRDLVDDRSLSQEGFKVDWFRAFVGDGDDPAAELRDRARDYRETDTLSSLKLKWLAEVSDPNAEADPDVRGELRDHGLLWFEKFAERWTRAFRGNRSAG